MLRPFQETLDDVERTHPDAERERPAFAPPGGSAPAFAFDAELATGSHYLWDRAAHWVPDAEPVAPAPLPPKPLRKSAAAPKAEPPRPLPPPSVEPAAIAVELGLSRLATADDLNRARRKFMWDNHPDRRADLSREIAHRRVATANMLLDRAMAHLARRKRQT